MALLGNYSVLNKTCGKFIAGSSVAGASNCGDRANFNKSGANRNFFAGWMNVATETKTASVPSGSSTNYAWVLPITAGGMAMRAIGSSTNTMALIPQQPTSISLTGSGTLLADIKGIGNILCALVGSNTFTSSISANGNITIDAIGSGSLVADISGKGNIVIDLIGDSIFSADASLFSGMVCNMIGSGTLSADALLLLSMLCDLDGSGSLTANLVPEYPMGIDMVGSGTLSSNISGLANVFLDLIGSSSMANDIHALADMSIDIVVTGTGLTTENVGAAVLNTPIEGNYTAAEVMRLLSAVAAGKSTIIDLGGGLATVTFRDINDTTDRVVADMTNSERTNVTKNL